MNSAVNAIFFRLMFKYDSMEEKHALVNKAAFDASTGI